MRKGIVLKVPHTGRLLSLIDEQEGRIDVGMVRDRTFSPGAMLRYCLIRKPVNRLVIDSCKIQEMPLALARQDIEFLHHVLELCYYFVPVGSCTNGIFELLSALYSPECALWSDASKKFFVFRLMRVIGYYSSHSEDHNLKVLLTRPVAEIIMDEQVKYCEAVVTQWLQRCLIEHPAIKQFRTLSFLTRGLAL